jgi:hypothetical protein
MLQELVQSITASRKSITPADASKIVEAAATLGKKEEQAPTDPVTPEPEATEEPKTEVEDTSDSSEPITDPVKTEDVDHDWKKRYADLKRHVDTDIKKQLEEERKKRLEAEKALKEGSTKYVKAEDLTKFEEEYGDLAPVVKELAFKEANKLVQDYIEQEEAKKQAQALAETEKKNYLTEAQSLVSAKHPDWKDIGESKMFQTWLGTQLDVTKRLAGDSDPQSVILVLDLYKKDTGYAAKKAAEAKKAKTEAVKVIEEPVKPASPEVFDVVALKKEISKAQKTGNMEKLGELLQKFDKLTKKGK